jgi:two-component system sensor histidine kinase KdpD
VCVSEDPRAAGLVRYAKRLADRLHAPWTALAIETRRSVQLSDEERDRIADTLRLAQALGGEPITIPGGDRRIADDIVAYAQVNNVTHIIVGKSRRTRWFEILHGSVVHDLVRTAGNISVHVIAGEATAEAAPQRTAVERRREPFEPRAYALSAIAVAVAGAVGMVLWPWIGTENTDLVFLTAIVAVAVRFGLWPSLFASVISALAYNFLFTVPYYTFVISDPREVVAVIFFTIVAIVVSNVAARARVQAVVATGRARTTESLYAFSRKLAGVGTLDDVLWASAYQTALMLKIRVVMLLPDASGALAVRSGYPPEDILGDADLAAAKWAWQNEHPAGRGSDTLPGAKWLFLPMRTGRAAIGVVGIDSDKLGPMLTPDERRLLDALIDQSALAIERVNLVEAMDLVRRSAETERLRSALLTSISHDLKTPLAAVIGAASTLRGLSPKLSEGERADLLATIVDESERLNRFIANLLDMTRLESGAVAPKTSLQDLRDMVGAAIRRAEKVAAGHRVEIGLAGELPMISVDPVLFEQALFNLLDNAAKYSPPGSVIRVDGWRDGRSVGISVTDEGEGIPSADLERIFDKFYRVHKTDRVRAGTGLGLAISRGFIEAMQGTITAANRTDRKGSVFTVRLPVPGTPARLSAAA